MSHNILISCIVKVSVLGYFPLDIIKHNIIYEQYLQTICKKYILQ